MLAWSAPPGRVESTLQQGLSITPYYDSMQAKLIAYGSTREQARLNLLQMLEQTVLLGVHSNRDFLCRVLADSEFAAGRCSTGFIGQYFPAELIKTLHQPDLVHVALAGALLYHGLTLNLSKSAGLDAELMQWHSAAPAFATMLLNVADAKVAVGVTAFADNRYQVSTPNGSAQIRLTYYSERIVWYEFDGISGQASQVHTDATLWLQCNGLTLCYEDQTYLAADKKPQGPDGRLTAPMDGKIMALLVQPGDRVGKGQTLAVLEAMKMEFSIVASMDGIIDSISCQTGLQVKVRQLLIVLKPLEFEQAL